MTAFALSPLNLSVTHHHGYALLALSGDLDAATAPQLGTTVEQLVATAPDRIVLDAGHLRYATPHGIDALVTAGQAAAAADVVLALADLQPLVWTALRSADDAGHLAVFGSVSAAAVNDLSQMYTEWL
ncbi:MAG: STAS domain-containing protein [Actinocatenispora sp.]